MATTIQAPEKWVATNSNNSEYIDIDTDAGRVCSVYVGPEAPEGNRDRAALIESAPALQEQNRELLEALKLAENYVMFSVQNGMIGEAQKDWGLVKLVISKYSK